MSMRGFFILSGQMVNIGVDFDDTLSDRMSVKKKLIEEHYGRDVDPFFVRGRNSVDLIGEETFSQIMDFLEGRREGVFETKPIPYSLEILGRFFSQSFGLYLISTTSHERMNWIRDWLSSYGISDYFSGFETTNISQFATSKEGVCDRLGIDFLVDNEQRNFTFLNSNLRRVLFSQNGETNDSRLYLARDWRDVYRIVKAPPPGFEPGSQG